MTDRDPSIDAIKGVGILSIVLLHFEDGIFPSWLNYWFGHFMISTFYFTSGWVMGLRTSVLQPGGLFKKRLRQLGIPYMCFSGLVLLFVCLWVLLGFYGGKIVLRDLYKTLVFSGIGTLWFLPVLFAGEWLFCYLRNSKYFWYFALVLFVVSIIYCHYYYVSWLPHRETDDIHRIIDAPMFTVVRILTAWPIVGMGYLSVRYVGPLLQRLNRVSLVLLGMVCIALSVLRIRLGIPSLGWFPVWGNNILPELGFMCVFLACGANAVTDFFVFWGRNSLILMATHFSIVEEIFKVIDNRLLGHTSFTGWFPLLYFCLTILLSYPLVSLFRKKLPFMLGNHV